MQRLVSVCAFVLLTGAGGCTIDVPIGDLSGVGQFLNDLQNTFGRLVEDPLETRPYPVLIGGDSQSVFYATSLTDVRLNFRGRANDVILPSPIGPSNLYVYRDGQRELLRPLILTGAFYGLTTDGARVAYIRTDVPEDYPVFRLVVSDLATEQEQVFFDSSEETGAFAGVAQPLALANGRLAMTLYKPDELTAFIRVFDLRNVEPEREFTSEYFSSVALRGDLLAYAEQQGSTDRIVLVNLSTDQSTVIAENVRGEYFPVCLPDKQQARLERAHCQRGGADSRP